MSNAEKNQKIVDKMVPKIEGIVKEVSLEELSENNEKKKIVTSILEELEKEIKNEN